MNFAKRAFLSVSKSIGKSILLILVLTVIGTMVLSGIAIQNSTNHEMNLAREKLGAEVTLSFDDIKAITGEISADTYYLKEEDVNKLINLPQVKNYNYITSGMVSPKDFDIVELFTEELDDK